MDYIENILKIILIFVLRNNFEEKFFIGLVALVHGISSRWAQLKTVDHLSARIKQKFLCIFIVDELNITMPKLCFRLLVREPFMYLDDFSKLRLN